jgi:hypothetical protein
MREPRSRPSEGAPQEAKWIYLDIGNSFRSLEANFVKISNGRNKR